MQRRLTILGAGVDGCAAIEQKARYGELVVKDRHVKRHRTLAEPSSTIVLLGVPPDQPRVGVEQASNGLGVTVCAAKKDVGLGVARAQQVARDLSPLRVGSL